MDVFECQANLDEPVEDLSLAKKLLVLDFTLYVVAQVANLAILHDDY